MTHWVIKILKGLDKGLVLWHSKKPVTPLKEENMAQKKKVKKAAKKSKKKVVKKKKKAKKK